jgi:hypothetical protein
MSNTSFECPFQYNISTTLVNDEREYKKRLQESTDPLRYRFDIGPGQQCYPQSRGFQGLALTSKRTPPSQYIDIDSFMRVNQYIEEDNKGVIENIHEVEPSMPSILNNQINFTQCNNDYLSQNTRIKRSELPQYGTPLDIIDRKNRQPGYMQAGIDTQLAVKDRYKHWRQTTRQPNEYLIPTDTLPSPNTIGRGPTLASNINPCRQNYDYCGRLNQDYTDNFTNSTGTNLGSVSYNPHNNLHFGNACSK